MNITLSPGQLETIVEAVMVGSFAAPVRLAEMGENLQVVQGEAWLLLGPAGDVLDSGAR